MNLGYGLTGTLCLILDVYVIYLIVISASEWVMKLVWVLLVLIMPLVGAILYLIVGRGNTMA